ncbi:unnamed protein product [Linum tenue]|uniref:Uncharacterized protein n=1 Tax=Linum tenue TaxID=586396 RepID=A0AAV0HVB3_9ROSI|nr:unnamed protein product [Linum tenue]
MEQRTVPTRTVASGMELIAIPPQGK